MSMISEQVKELRIAAAYKEHSLKILLEQAADTIEALSAKVAVANMGQSDRYYNGGWISCKERLPEEHESMFSKFKGTNKWNDAMFEKISDEVNVTVEFEDGKRKTMTLQTCDGKWRTDMRIVKFKVIAWQPLPEPCRP